MELPINSKDVVVFFHDSCVDGFASASLMYTKYTEAKYYPVNYGRKIEVPVEGKVVFFVDFCPDTEWVSNNWLATAQCIVLDHHKDAMDKVTHIREIIREQDKVDFEMEHSGVGLVWHYLNGTDAKMPPMVYLVEQRDLWKLTPDMRKYHEYFVTFLSKDLPEIAFPPMIKALLTTDQTEIDKITEMSETLVRARDQHVQWFMTSAAWWYRDQTVNSPSGDIKTTVAMLNCPHIFISEVASQIMEHNARVDLVIGTSIGGRGMGFSFRSRGGTGLASHNAKKFSGGGHADAAGGRYPGLLSYADILDKVSKP